MNKQILGTGVLACALFGCQSDEYVNPVEDPTGNAPHDSNTVYQFDSAHAPTYLDANLAETNAISASFVNTEAGITPIPVNGLLPDFAGAEANLLAGVGFGTYANPDYRLPTDWAGAGDFKSVVTAEVTLNNEGDDILLCRSFATTCVDLVSCDGDLCPSGIDVAIVRLAANAPDTDIGEISPGVSAAIRGTGPSGLTIAITDQSTVGLPFVATNGTPFEVTWTVSRGDLENSIDWAVAINGTEIGSGNSAVDLAGAIVKTGGVGLIFDQPFGTGNGPAVDYSYAFDGAGDADFFADPIGVGVPLSPQLGLGHAPLFVYPTEDDAHVYGTMSGYEGTPHAVQPGDGIVGLVTQAGGASNQQFVYSVAFNGDDFDGTPAEGLVDWGGTGGGFYPAPTFCYNQIIPAVDAKVQAGVRKEIHRLMYAHLATGVVSANVSLPTIVGGLNANFSALIGHTVVYTAVTPTDAITIGTDFADSNVDTAIATSAGAHYNATFAQSVSTTFKTQYVDIFTSLNLDTDPGTAGVQPVYTAMGITAPQYGSLAALFVGLTTPPGVMDGTVDAAGAPLYDEYPPFEEADCQGYDCNVAWLTEELATGFNDSGNNPSEGVPALAATCLWGVAPSAAVAASAAVFVPDANFDNDAPAYAAIAATAVTPPVREQAAPSMNTLVMGIYGNFIGAVFGPGVPASNFSLAMGAGDPEAEAGPSLTSLSISNGTAAGE